MKFLLLTGTVNKYLTNISWWLYIYLWNLNPLSCFYYQYTVTRKKLPGYKLCSGFLFSITSIYHRYHINIHMYIISELGRFISEIILLFFLSKFTIKIKLLSYKIYCNMKFFYQLYSSNISLHLVKKLTLIFRKACVAVYVTQN